MSERERGELYFKREHISIADIYRIGKAIGVLRQKIVLLSDGAARAADALHQEHDLRLALGYIEGAAGVHCEVEAKRLTVQRMILSMAEKSE